MPKPEALFNQTDAQADKAGKDHKNTDKDKNILYKYNKFIDYDVADEAPLEKDDTTRTHSNKMRNQA